MVREHPASAGFFWPQFGFLRRKYLLRSVVDERSRIRTSANSRTGALRVAELKDVVGVVRKRRGFPPRVDAVSCIYQLNGGPDPSGLPIEVPDPLVTERSGDVSNPLISRCRL